MGANFSDDWSSDNRERPPQKTSTEIKLPEQHQLYFAKERRRGKVVTTVQPFFLSANDLKALLKRVKRKLGTGGTVREACLEFQGEVQKGLKIELEKLGYRFK